jgi:hypothetical protein
MLGAFLNEKKSLRGTGSNSKKFLACVITFFLAGLFLFSNFEDSSVLTKNIDLVQKPKIIIDYKNISFYDRITSVEFKAMSDMYLGYHCGDANVNLTRFGTNCWYHHADDIKRFPKFSLSEMKPGVVVYVDNPNLRDFSKFLKSGKITIPFVLVSNEADWVSPYDDHENDFLGNNIIE